MSDIDAMMSRIQKLLDTAESLQSGGNPEAAATYREKAESLMRTYRIEEESLVREAISSGAPIWREFRVAIFESEFRSEMHAMFWWISRHCGVEYHIAWVGRNMVADAVGYEIDLRLMEMIFESARLAFLARLDPTYDPAESAAGNIYRLRGAGIDRQKVAAMVFGQGGHSEGIRVGKIYREECQQRNEVDAVSGRGFNRAAYRRAYADEFCKTIAYRLRKARDAADSVGGALVLPARAERVKEALYARYESERPMTEAELKAQEEANKDDKPVKIKPPTKAELASAARFRGPAADRARAAGRSAAESVDLVRETESANRAESAERTGLNGESRALKG